MIKSRISTKGPKNGICNICGEDGKLTEDHTPPKGSIRIRQVELLSILNHLHADMPSKNGRILQNGMKYRTLCHKCNNDYLGAKYDPAFNEFVNTVGDYLKSNIHLPKSIRTEIKPQKIMKSLIGHLAAQGVNRYKKGPDTELIRDYIVNPSYTLPENIRIYYWLFPYKNHVMARDCAFLDLRVGKPCVIWFLKFFPISFLVTFNQPAELQLNVSELSKWREFSIDEKAIEHVQLTNLPHQFWPEAPTDHSIITYGQEAVVSYKYKSKKH